MKELFKVFWTMNAVNWTAWNQQIAKVECTDNRFVSRIFTLETNSKNTRYKSKDGLIRKFK